MKKNCSFADDLNKAAAVVNSAAKVPAVELLNVIASVVCAMDLVYVDLHVDVGGKETDVPASNVTHVVHVTENSVLNAVLAVDKSLSWANLFRQNREFTPEVIRLYEDLVNVTRES